MSVQWLTTKSVRRCSLPGTPHVVNLEPTCLEDVFRCMLLMGDVTGRTSQARKVTEALRQRAGAVERRSAAVTERPRVLLLEWIDPPFCAGHWSPELVRLAGGREVIGVEGRPSRTMSWSEVVEADPDVLVLACCGFSVERTLADLPVLRSYPEWETLRCVQANSVFVVDGSAYFNRPGPRLVDSLEIPGRLGGR